MLVKLRYAPSPGQLAFHKARYDSAERLLTCGSGGGKTYAMLFEVLDWTLENPGPGTILYAMPTVPMFKKSVPDTWRHLTGSELGQQGTLGADYNRSDRLLRLPNGWDVWFVTVDDPTNIEGPPSVDLAVLDEARVVRRVDGEDGAWAQLTRRLRGTPGDGRRRGAIMGTHSPNRAIMDLFKRESVTRYRAPGRYGVGYYEVAECGGGRLSFTWGTGSAVAWGTLSQSGADNILRGLTSESARQRVFEGRFARASGVVYAGFDEAKHLRRFEGKPDRVTGGIDWGWDVTALTVHAWGPSTVTTVAEAGGEHWDLRHIARAMRDLERKWGRIKWYGGHDRPDSMRELGSIDVDGERLGFSVEPYNGRVMDGVGIMQSRLQAGEWFVSPDCGGVREDLDNYSFGDDGQPDKLAFDAHYLDSVRYGVCGSLKGTRTGGITW